MSKILIVDDNPNNIQLLATVLSANKFEIEYAENGYDAIELFDEMDFDLVLMDVMMPGIDGFETTKRIKSKDNKKNIPFIFITANTDVDSITMAFKLGGVDYITKPFNEIELLARVDTHLSLYKARNELESLNKTLELKVKERTAELNEANTQLEELDNAKNEFLNIISHEIRTPLNGIIGMSNLIKESVDDEKVNTLFEYLDESQKRLENFAIKALEITDLRIKKNLAIKKEKLNISQLTNEILDNPILIEKINHKNISINIDITQQEIFADKKFIAQLLKILIENAVKHTKDNSNIDISLSPQNDNIIIKIKDGGNGFPDKIISSRSSYFVSEHIDKNPGLDLFLCKLIASAHNGLLELTNDNGAIAIVKLPIS